MGQVFFLNDYLHNQKNLYSLSSPRFTMKSSVRHKTDVALSTGYCIHTDHLTVHLSYKSYQVHRVVYCKYELLVGVCIFTSK